MTISDNVLMGLQRIVTTATTLFELVTSFMNDTQKMCNAAVIQNCLQGRINKRLTRLQPRDPDF